MSLQKCSVDVTDAANQNQKEESKKWKKVTNSNILITWFCLSCGGTWTDIYCSTHISTTVTVSAMAKPQLCKAPLVIYWCNCSVWPSRPLSLPNFIPGRQKHNLCFCPHAALWLAAAVAAWELRTSWLVRGFNYASPGQQADLAQCLVKCKHWHTQSISLPYIQ